MLFKQNGKVRCQLCGNMYAMITTTHLKKKHKMTMAEYKEKFPEAPITAEEFNALSNYSSKDEPKVDDAPIIIESSPVIEDEEFIEEPEIIENPEPVIITQISQVQEEPEPEEESLPAPVFDGKGDDDILKTKIEVYNWLRFYFNDLKQNMKIDKTHHFDGSLFYSYYADFIDKKQKINFQFPKAGFHQPEVRPEIRDNQLREDGWRIITIEDHPITVKCLKDALTELG